MLSGENKKNRDKATRLINYLLRLASLRTRLIRDISEYENVLWVSRVPDDRGCYTQAWGRDEEHEPDDWMEVQNRREPELPAVPVQCKDWVNPASLRNKNDLPTLLHEITQEITNPNWCEHSDQSKTISNVERLEDQPEVQQAWDDYVEHNWLPWTEEHNAWEKVHKVYTALFAIHQSQLRLGEEYELVLGLGLLTWQTPTGQRVRRHLVAADAVLEFEAQLGRFTVRPHTDGAKLRPELDMLDIADQPARAEEIAKSSLASAEDDPWEKSCVKSVLQALVHSINSHGDFIDSLEATNIHLSQKPIVEYAPALILRKRSTKGLTETLKRIKEQIESGEVIPGEFADLAEIHRTDNRELSDGPDETNATFDGEIFFPKPSNDEQRRIVDKICTANGVLVQGPPGTGKSHTIANLICHLLATGQRTLITAKTPRALQVLEGLVPEELRPLCVNLLGSGIEEKRSLESSVGGILRKNDEWNEKRAEQVRAELEDSLRKLREENAKVNRRLRDIRESETHTQSIADGAYRGTAARIAEEVNRDRADYEWFAESIPLDMACQISINDLAIVLSALRQFTKEKRRELGLVWPEALPSPERFSNFVKDEANATDDAENAACGADERLADLLERSNSASIEVIRSAFSKLRDSRRILFTTPYTWMNEALRDIVGSNSSLWHERLRITKDVIASIEALVEVADKNQIEMPNTNDLRPLREDARKLKEHLENGGKLGWGIFRPKSVKDRLYAIKAVKIGGRSCSTVEHFSTLADVMHVRIECEKAWDFWRGRNEKVEGPYTLQLAVLKSLCSALEGALSLEELILNCREAKNLCPGMGEPVWADEHQIEMVVSSCRLALARIRKRLAADEIQGIAAPVSQLSAKGSAHQVTNELLSAIRSRDVDKFAQCANRIQEFEKQRHRLQKVDEYISKQRRSLPEFIRSLEATCNEPYWEERVQRISDAWHWAQARYWIEEYIRQEDVPALSKRVKQIEDEISSIIAKLAALHAWSFCFSRLKEDHRRHMEAFRKHTGALTQSGKGKRDFRNRRAAQRSLNECKDAVPAWVMPLHRVWDTIEPAPEMFDVIIVDEASQCGFEALPLLYLGKKVLIVGDDKQISPSGEFQDTTPINKLLSEYLYDFNFKEYFDVNVSLFDHGKLRYGTQRIVLREHFRCMPEIIRFSNDLCYFDTPLIPLRQYGLNRLTPLEHVFVTGGYREGTNNRTINRCEADAIVAKIIEMCSDNRYDSKTMGVVVLQGDAQAALIENQLLERLGAEEMERRRLICGNPYSFQGDERDIMFLSLVAANNERIGALTKAADERRFNVAASRARDMMILFHSVTSEDLSTSCLRRKLLEFFENTKPQANVAGFKRDELERQAFHDNRRIVKPPIPFESWFEVDVALELFRRDFTVLAQHEVAGKRIDLVVEGGHARLAVECDGDHWHGADRYEADMQRKRQLERCGWEFVHVRESAFYANRNEALKELWQALEDRGIAPLTRSPSEGDLNNDIDDESENETGDDTTTDNEDDFTDNTECDISSTGRRAEEITAADLREAIVQVLSLCPNVSCTLHSLTSRVLKEVGVLTRGNPRAAFEKRVMRCLVALERQKVIERYQRSKNKRVRLIGQMSTANEQLPLPVSPKIGARIL